jgi:hypothetical protein
MRITKSGRTGRGLRTEAWGVEVNIENKKDERLFGVIYWCAWEDIRRRFRHDSIGGWLKERYLAWNSDFRVYVFLIHGKLSFYFFSSVRKSDS